MRENVVGENPQLELRPPNPARAFFIPEAIYGVAVGTSRIGEFLAARVGPGAGIVFPLLFTMKSPPTRQFHVSPQGCSPCRSPVFRLHDQGIRLLGARRALFSRRAFACYYAARGAFTGTAPLFGRRTR
jgi:hypothetical protein